MLAENAGTIAARTAKAFPSHFRLATRRCSSSHICCWSNSRTWFKTAREDLETCTAKTPTVLIVCRGGGWSIPRRTRREGLTRGVEERMKSAQNSVQAKFAFLPSSHSKGGKIHPLWDDFLAKRQIHLPFCQEPLMCVMILRPIFCLLPLASHVRNALMGHN